MRNSLVRNIVDVSRMVLLPSPLFGADAQNTISSLLESPQPCMIARFGSSEIQGTINGASPWPFCLILRQRIWSHLINNAGFFPVNRQSVIKFSRLMVNSMSKCDCLASWRIEELLFAKHLHNAMRIRLSDLGPSDNNFWYRTLAGKKVLVISPLAELIEIQYNNHRESIWPKSKILPRFESLSTIRAVNSIQGRCEFSSYFEALEYMEREIDTKDYDIALIGCGAYGFPLASYIKERGKKSVHIGGAIQLLFGIYGKRWENIESVNCSWTRPRIIDRPIGYESVEGGCYW